MTESKICIVPYHPPRVFTIKCIFHGKELLRNFRIQVQAQTMYKFFLNLELMSIYLNLAFVWGPESCGIFYKPECYMINVLKFNCALIPIISSKFTKIK